MRISPSAVFHGRHPARESSTQGGGELRMRKRIIGPIAAIAAAGLVLAGCASEGEETPGTETDSPDTTEETPGGDMAAGCEDFETYGVHEGAEVELYHTI